MLTLISCLSALCAVGEASPQLMARVPDGCRMVEGSLRFSRDGAKCVYVVTKGEKQCPVVGSTIGGEYEEVSWPTIDPSGAHTAFRARSLDAKKKVYLYSILYDGKVLATDDWIGPIALDPAKGAPAYWIAHGRIQTASGFVDAGPATLVWGKYKSAKWQFTDDASAPQFTSEGGWLVTIAARGSGDWNVVTVDSKGKDDKHGTGSLFEVTPQPAGSAFACTWANLYGEERWMHRKQQFLVTTTAIDKRGQESTLGHFGRSYESSGSPVYTPDGRHLAFKVMKSSKMGAAIDNQEGAVCDYTFVDALAPKLDGSEVAFVACNGCKLDAKNGQEVLRGVKAKGGQWFVLSGSTRRGEYELAHSPTWSPDGASLAYAAKSKGKWYVFAGSKQSEACEEVACIVWSEDGHAVSYGCCQGAEVLWCSLDAG